MPTRKTDDGSPRDRRPPRCTLEELFRGKPPEEWRAEYAGAYDWVRMLDARWLRNNEPCLSLPLCFLRLAGEKLGLLRTRKRFHGLLIQKAVLYPLHYHIRLHCGIAEAVSVDPC